MATQKTSKAASQNKTTKPKKIVTKKIVTKKIVNSAEVNSSAVAEAAYYIAEQRGFAPGYEVEDWLVAEQTVKNKSTST